MKLRSPRRPSKLRSPQRPPKLRSPQRPPRGASQPSASPATVAAARLGVWNLDAHTQCRTPQSEHVSVEGTFVCARVNIVSFNFGVQQTMLESCKGGTKNALKLCRLLEKFGQGSDGDFIFGCELGGHREGFAAAEVDFENIVSEALPHAQSTTHGAYAVVYQSIAQLKDAGTFEPKSVCDAEMHWTIFEISFHGASQPADVPVYLIAGNVHIRTPSNCPSPTMKTRRYLTQLCLNHLAGLGKECGDKAAVVRILCGDVNLRLCEAIPATQDCARPCSGIFSKTGALSRWDCVGTEANLSGDLVFVNGAFAEQYAIPVGASYEDRGMRNDSHDAVAIHVDIPLRSVSQPAEFGGDYILDAEVCATPDAQRSVSPEHWQPAEFGGVCSPDAEARVYALHTVLRQAEASEELDPDVQQQLVRLLFAKRTIVVDGRRRSYVADTSEVLHAIRMLLHRRTQFLKKKGLPSDHMLLDAERQEVMRQWKDEFHTLPDQRKLQLRDSFKEDGDASQPAAERSGKGKVKGQLKPHSEGKPRLDGFGPNKTAVRSGMHSRFARHMQLVGGTKQICEMIIFTGMWNVESLQRLQDRSASQPAVALHKRPENQLLKTRANVAKFQYRLGKYLAFRRNNDTLSDEDRALVELFNNGTLLREANAAIMAYGHGTLRDPQSTATIAIGGSTGGYIREFLNDRPSLDAGVIADIMS